MKKTDIAMIILISSVGVLVAYLIATNLPFLRLPEDGVKVQTIPTITAEIVEPSKDVFNEDAINPTVEVILGDGGGSVTGDGTSTEDGGAN